VEREGVRGWKNCQSGQFTPRPPFIWTDRRTGLSGPNLDRIFRASDKLEIGQMPSQYPLMTSHMARAIKEIHRHLTRTTCLWIPR
jgi:hypothetical protein